MKNLTKIFVFFTLTILFAGSAYAQYNIPDPVPAAPTYRCVPPDPNSAHSPSEACQLWERVVYCTYTSETWTISGSGSDCTVTSYIALNGRYNYYYSGDQYCRERIGSSFDNFKKCELRTDIAQPTPIPKLAPAPGFQPLLEKSGTQLEIERRNKQIEEDIKQANQEITREVQEQNEKSQTTGSTEGEETHYGTVEILRNGKITPLDSYIKANAGDIIKTGSDGFMEYGLNNSRTILGPDTLGVVLGLDKSNKKVITPYEWDKDPSYRPELNHWEFWKNTATDLIDFINQNRPDYLEDCAVGNVYGCSWGTVEFIHGGVGWFNEKIEKDFPKNMVVTPTVAMVPVGTEFSVVVDQNGATTVTTLDGEVIVMDLTSRKSAIVGAYQTITIPKTDKGLTAAELQQGLTKVDPGSIDKWWEKKTQEQIDEEFRYFMIGSFAILIVVIILILIFKKIIKNRKK